MDHQIVHRHGQTRQVFTAFGGLKSGYKENIFMS